MNIFLEKFREIQLNPLIYLARPTLIFLKTFIDGYAIRERELNGDANCELLEGFQNYIAEKFHDKKALNWACIIEKQYSTEEEAFSAFFELLETYVKESPIWHE